MRVGAAVGGSLALLLALITARAPAADVSDTDRQIAQSLFDEARALLEANRVAEACPKFAESQRLDPGGGTLLNLALCLEMEGRSGSAWARYQEALALAVRDRRKDREEFARAHLAALAPKLVRVVVVVPPELAQQDLEVHLDGSRLPREAWGTAIAVDPGSHLVSSQTATAPRWETRVEATKDGQSYRVEVGVGAASTPPPVAEPAPTPAPAKRRSTAFWLTLGGGTAALAAGAVFGVTALDNNTAAEDGCVSARSFCTQEARDAASTARTHAWLSTGLMAAGAAAIVVAWILPLEVVAAPTRGGATAKLGFRF